MSIDPETAEPVNFPPPVTRAAVWFRRLERVMLRPLFLFCTFVLVLLALVQASGRFALTTMSLFSDELNAVTQPLGVHVRGLVGSWSGLNPVIRADQVVFAGGYASHVEIEVDLLESAYRSHLIPRRVAMDELFLDIVETAAGWGLRGAETGRAPPDVMPILRNVDALSVRALVSLTAASGEVARVQGALSLQNTQGQHFARVDVATDADDGLALELWAEDAPLLDVAQSRRVSATGRLNLPLQLIGLETVTLDLRTFDWQEDAGQGRGKMQVALANLKVPGEVHTLQAHLVAELGRKEERLLASFDEFSLAPSDTAVGVPTIDLNGLQLVYSLALLDNDAELKLWHPGVRLDPVTALGGHVMSSDKPAGRWIRGMSPQGALNNLHAFLELGEDLDFGFSASLADLTVQAYRGAPMVTQAQGQIWGSGRTFALQLNAEAGQLQFPDLFTDVWEFDYLQGLISAWVRPGYFAMRGANIKTRINGSNVSGTYSLTRPDPRFEQRIGLQLSLDQTDMIAAKSFVPFKIPDDLAGWLSEGPQGGHLTNATFLYQGQVHLRANELGRRIELMTDLERGRVRYDEAWPVVSDLVGRVHVAGRTTRIEVDGGRSQGLALYDSSVTLVDNGVYADIDLNARGDGTHALQFILSSPLADSLNFVTPDWTSSGELKLTGSLLVPIKREEAPELDVAFDFSVADFDLDMPEYRLGLNDLSGSGEFTLPHLVNGQFSGWMFGESTEITVLSDPAWIRFGLQGAVGHADVYRLIAYEDIGVMDGLFGFEGTLSIAMADKNVTQLSVQSDLVGLALKLPSYLAKTSDVESAMELDVQFLEDYQSIRWDYKNTQGWVHFGDEIERGAIGVGVAPPTTAQDQQAIAISGALDRLALSEWVSDDGEAKVALPLDWKISGLRIGAFIIDEIEFADLVLGGEQTGEDVSFTFASEALTGMISLPAEGVMDIDLQELRLPSSESEDELALVGGLVTTPSGVDPIDLSVGGRLPYAKVELDLLSIGAEPFGSWRFLMEPKGDVVEFRDFNADVNGVHISSGTLEWDLTANRSRFVGEVVLDDLAQTLPLWDYAPVLQTDSARVVANADWSGSPANVSLVGLNGDLAFAARDGRFLDVEAGGGLRMMSLLNFSNIAKRINLDFTDVTREGIGFDKIDAKVNLDSGELTFLERMIVEGTSSNFQIGGNVDLNTGSLDNEMIVTLPVSDSLPWYGVYLGLANPLAGLGVVIGERVLRKPLRAFSTAKFSVTGTLDEPEVKFVSLWDQSLSQPDPVPENAPAVLPEVLSEDPPTEISNDPGPVSVLHDSLVDSPDNEVKATESHVQR